MGLVNHDAISFVVVVAAAAAVVVTDALGLVKRSATIITLQE